MTGDRVVPPEAPQPPPVGKGRLSATIDRDLFLQTRGHAMSTRGVSVSDTIEQALAMFLAEEAEHEAYCKDPTTGETVYKAPGQPFPPYGAPLQRK